MAISNQYGDREYNKFKESTDVGGQIGIVVVNPDGSTISGGGGGGSSNQYQDGTAIATQYGNIMMATDGSNLRFLSSNSSGELNLNNIGGTISLPTGAATETTLSSALTKLTDIETNTDSLAGVTSTTVGADTGLDVNVISGINVEVDLDAADDSVLVYGFDGASNQKIATDASGNLQIDVLSSALPSGAATESTLSSIDTDTTTIAAKVTDIETNTDSLATITNTTVGADTGLDVNVIGGINVEVDLNEADDSVQVFGNDGTSNQAIKTDADGHLQVDVLSGAGGVANAIDSNNSTTSTLGAGATFTGTGTDVLTYTSITVLLKTDQDSAANGMQFQFSTDNTNWDETHNYTYNNSVDSTAREFQFPVHARYFRVVYTNGGVAQTHFRLQTILHGNNVLPGIIRVGDTIYGDRSATLVKSVLSGESSAGGGTYENVKVAPSGSLEVNASQDTHDDFNANVNLQVADTDVSNSNPVPVSDAGGSLTVDNAGLTELAAAINASSQLDINVAADAVGLATQSTLASVDTTATAILADTAAIDTSTASIDTKLTTTNSKLTDIETNTDSLASVTNTTVGAKTGLDVNIIEGINVEVDLDAADDSVLVYGFDGTSNQKIKTDASGNVQVDIVADAAGLATESTLSNLDTTATSILADTAAIDTSTSSIDTKLTTTNSKLTDIETNTDSLAVTGGGVEATALRVTLANDSTGVLSVDDNGGSLTVDGTVAATQSGTWNINNISGTVSLPTGAATESTLSSIDTDTTTIATKVTDIETNTDSLATITNTTVGADTGLDVNVIGGINVEVDLDAADDSVLVYGFDGTSNQKIKTDSSGNLQVDIVADAAGLATESTLSNLDTTATSILADTAAIDTSTASIDTKLTTTNAKLTDIETNTDSLTVVGGGTEATALRVTLANDSTGVLTVDDGGGSLTVDGTVAATQSGTWNINDISGTISLPTGAATESTLNSILTKATDIETNTDALATVTKTTISADTGLDVNVINTVNTNTTITRQANISNSQTQGTGNISVSIAPGVLFKVIAVYLKFQAVPTANDFDVTIVDLAQPFYNTTVFSVDPGTLGITNVSWVPDGEVMVLPGQTLDLTFTNTATTQFGLTVIYEQIQ